jgi:hypothetical protein
LALAACCASRMVLMIAAGRLSYDITIMDGGMIDIGFGCVYVYVMRYWLDTLLMVLLRIARCMTDILGPATLLGFVTGVRGGW